MKRLLPLLLLGVLGCAVNSTPPTPAPSPRTVQRVQRLDVAVWSAQSKPWVEDWRREIGRRYRDAAIIFCHGGNDGHQWVFCPDKQWLEEPVIGAIARLRKDPNILDRRIVLVTCNPGGYVLPASCGAVTYCEVGSMRWAPDKPLLVWAHPEWVGNVFELVERR